MVKVWELPRLAGQAFLDRYFANLEGLLDSGLFDAVGHADTLLRGVPEDIFLRRFEPLLAPLARSGIAFELNASGLRKSSLDPKTAREGSRAFILFRLGNWWHSLRTGGVFHGWV